MEPILLVATLLCLAVFLWTRRQDPRLPPSPRAALPLVGHFFYVGTDPRPTFKKWRETCGDIFSINIFGTLMVVLNGFDIMKEAFVKKADAFSDRSPVFMDIATGLPGKGVAFSSGNNWKEQRSVSLAILRKFGMGKNILAERIQEEVASFVNYLSNINDKPIDIRMMANISASNIICSIIIGHRFDYDDQEFRHLIAHLNSVAVAQKNVSLINFMSWLRHLPGDLFKAKQTTTDIQAIMALLEKFISSKKQDFLEHADPDNFIEAYLAERKKKVEAGVSTYLDDESLTKIINDLFAAGTETTSTTLYWCVLYMLNHPRVQEKVHQEIKSQVGLGRAPNMQDRCQLPYLNAVIMETQRLASIVPLSLLHMCSEDITLQGHRIPKGTAIVPNLDSVLHDPKIWGQDAMVFRPERFLDGNGKVVDREELIPFGIGRRMCLGEAMAKMSLFLFLATMFQRLQFLPVGSQPPTCKEYNFGLACAPLPYQVRIVGRK